MPWFDTDNYKNKVKSEKNVVYDIDKLEKWKEEGWEPRFINVPKFLKRIQYARVVKLLASVNPKDIPFDFSAGFSCQNCGLFNRHPFCAPDRPPINIAENEVKSYENGVIFVIQNDGNSPWNEDPTALKHINFKSRKSFELRGAEIGTTRYIQKMMKLIEHKARKMGYRAQCFIPGHCEALCGKCIIKGLHDHKNEQLSCILGGLPSMESWWMNVYRYYTHGKLKVIFEQNNDVLKPFKFICDTHFTLITMLLYDRKKYKKYWYDEMIKDRLKDEKIKKEYLKIRDKIKKVMLRRKKEGIPR